MSKGADSSAPKGVGPANSELHAVIDHTPFMLVRCSRDLRYRFVSRAYAKLIGRQPEEVIGKSIAEVLGEEGFAAIQPHVEAALEGRSVEYETEIHVPGVGSRALHVIYRPETDDSGTVQGWIATLVDLTEQKRAERSRQQLASIVESSDAAIISKNLNGIIASWNRGAEYLFGYSSDEAIGRPITVLIPPDRQHEEPRILERIRRGERIEHYETVRQRKDGSQFAVSLSVSPVRDANGKIVGASKIAFDITARKRAEDALARRSEEQTALYRFTDRLYRSSSLKHVYLAALKAILRALHCDRVSILRADENGAMRFVAWHKLSAAYRKAVEGHSPWVAGDPSPGIVCIDNIDHAAVSDELKAVVKREGIRALAFIPLMVHGRLAGKFMTYYDVPHAFSRGDRDLALLIARQLGFSMERMQAETARRNAEESLRLLSERLEREVERRTLERDRIWNVSEDLLGVSNFEGYFLSINPAWTRLLGWSQAEVESMHVSKLRHPDDAAAAIAGRAQLASGVSTIRMENRFRHKDGSWRWISWAMTVESGLIYVAGRHVTSEREAAAALEQARRQSAHLQKMEALGQLTGGVAHDFNNLLMIVSGHAQTLRQRLGNSKDLRALDAIQMAASRGENLTRQLLSFSRSQPLNPEIVNPAEEIVAIRDVITGSMNIDIELSIDLPNSVWAACIDKSEFDLAIVNLAVNARDAMPGDGRLAISVRNVQLGENDTPERLRGEFVAVCVADTGCGIPAEVVSKVFEPFFTTKSADKGTGLGLAQVYGFAHRSGGTVTVASQVGHGTSVTIYLPRSDAIAAATPPEEIVRSRSPGRETVLVVEDNYEVRMATVSLLELLGYRTVAVDSAAAAMETLEASQKFSALFSDVVLPGRTDGLALARTVRDRYPHIPVVLTSGYAKAFEADCEYPVLRKPYQISALGRAIRDALDQAKAGNSLDASTVMSRQIG